MEDVKHLDLEGFRFAGRINLTAWAAGAERYISFLKGKSDVSEYFRLFLGCDSVVEARVDTSNLVMALKEFVTAEKMTERDGNEFLARAKAICERSSNKRDYATVRDYFVAVFDDLDGRITWHRRVLWFVLVLALSGATGTTYAWLRLTPSAYMACL
ncbi:hypothetical protein GLF_0955 [Gluconobacter frateurii NBRC 101659]|nr:hypothetical protein GLF_0955 [Gluconobacter frateurii NBRC 101659]